MPKNRVPEHWRGEKGLYCAGLSRRGLFGVSMDAEAIANDINKVITSQKKSSIHPEDTTNDFFSLTSPISI